MSREKSRKAGQTEKAEESGRAGRTIGKKLRMVFSMSWRISPAYILLVIVNALTGAAQILANVVLPKFLVDELTHDRRPEQLLLWGLAIVGSNLVFGFLGKLMKRNMEIQNEYMNQKINQALGIKIMHVDYSCLEDPYYLDLKERASFACVNQGAVYRLISGTAGILKSLATLAGLLTVMLTLGPVLLIVSAVVIVLTLLLLASFSGYQVSFFQQIIPVNRKYGYYLNLGFENDTIQKDARLYGMAPMLLERVLDYTNEFMGEFRRYYRKQGKIMGMTELLSNLHAALTYGYVGLRALGVGGGRIGLGSFTMYVNASIQFTAGFRDLMQNIVTAKQMLDYLDPFLELMELPELQQQAAGVPEQAGGVRRQADGTHQPGGILFEGEVEEISFEHLSFVYPGSDKEVLSDISFTIRKGEKVSIVGLNGAGKTTLIKLLCRLYRPSAGRILVNGRDIWEYDYDSYVQTLAAVFQDYKLFNFTLRENITAGKTCGDSLADEERVEQIVREVGLAEKLQELPRGLDSLYGKAYDEEGIELSGGQSQKVAIARALYKNASLVILDEPTSALDPLAEADIYQNFNQMVQNRTAIYISHRMSSSVFCDRILVIDGGRISDFDSHENLMKKGDSLYCRLFRAQAENYQEAGA